MPIVILLIAEALAAASPAGWYIRPDGSRQCQPNTSRKQDELKKELVGAKIPVIQILNIHDGAMRMQVCGAPTGQLDAVFAKPENARKLRSLGFLHAPPGLILPTPASKSASAAGGAP